MRTTLKLARTGYYELRYTEPSGRTRTVSTRTRDFTEAKAFRAAWIAAQASNVASKTPLVGEIIENYLTRYVYTRSRMSAQVFSLRLVRSFFGNMYPLEITPDVVLAYRAHRSAVKDGTVRRELGALMAALNWGVKARMIGAGDVPSIQMPPDSPPRKVFLDEAQEARLWDVAVADWRDNGRSVRHRAGLFIAIALATAARKEAIETLTWDRVDMAHKTIDFNDPKVRVSRKRRAVVPISDNLFPLLQEAMVAQGLAGNTTGFVLGAKGCVKNGFKRIVKDAGLEHIRIHDLRRTAATLMLRAGVDPWAVAGVLGDTLDTVMRSYAVHIPGHLQGAVNRVSSSVLKRAKQ